MPMRKSHGRKSINELRTRLSVEWPYHADQYSESILYTHIEKEWTYDSIVSWIKENTLDNWWGTEEAGNVHKNGLVRVCGKEFYWNYFTIDGKDLIVQII